MSLNLLPEDLMNDRGPSQRSQVPFSRQRGALNALRGTATGTWETLSVAQLDLRLLSAPSSTYKAQHTFYRFRGADQALAVKREIRAAHLPQATVSAWRPSARFASSPAKPPVAEVLVRVVNRQHMITVIAYAKIFKALDHAMITVLKGAKAAAHSLCERSLVMRAVAADAKEVMRYVAHNSLALFRHYGLDRATLEILEGQEQWKKATLPLLIEQGHPPALVESYVNNMGYVATQMTFMGAGASLGTVKRGIATAASGSKELGKKMLLAAMPVSKESGQQLVFVEVEYVKNALKRVSQVEERLHALTRQREQAARKQLLKRARDALVYETPPPAAGGGQLLLSQQGVEVGASSVAKTAAQVKTTREQLLKRAKDAAAHFPKTSHPTSEGRHLLLSVQGAAAGAGQVTKSVKALERAEQRGKLLVLSSTGQLTLAGKAGPLPMGKKEVEKPLVKRLASMNEQEKEAFLDELFPLSETAKAELAQVKQAALLAEQRAMSETDPIKLWELRASGGKWWKYTYTSVNADEIVFATPLAGRAVSQQIKPLMPYLFYNGTPLEAMKTVVQAIYPTSGKPSLLMKEITLVMENPELETRVFKVNYGSHALQLVVSSDVVQTSETLQAIMQLHDLSLKSLKVPQVLAVGALADVPAEFVLSVDVVGKNFMQMAEAMKGAMDSADRTKWAALFKNRSRALGETFAEFHEKTVLAMPDAYRQHWRLMMLEKFDIYVEQLHEALSLLSPMEKEAFDRVMKIPELKHMRQAFETSAPEPMTAHFSESLSEFVWSTSKNELFLMKNGKLSYGCPYEEFFWMRNEFLTFSTQFGAQERWEMLKAFEAGYRPLALSHGAEQESARKFFRVLHNIGVAADLIEGGRFSLDKEIFRRLALEITEDCRR